MFCWAGDHEAVSAPAEIGYCRCALAVERHYCQRHRLYFRHFRPYVRALGIISTPPLIHENTMKSNPIVHFEIYVTDMNRARAFYEAMLDTKLAPMPNPVPDVPMDMWFFPMDPENGMNSYGAGGMLVKQEGFEPGQGGTLVYFGCNDCAVEAARAAEHGGIIVQGKMALGEHGFCALVRDTEGNLVGLHSMA
jgi:predicted enzyme related to lactoylglutathione lyase